MIGCAQTLRERWRELRADHEPGGQSQAELPRRGRAQTLCERAAKIWKIEPDAVSWDNGFARPAGDNAGKFEPLSLAQIAAKAPETGGPIGAGVQLNVEEAAPGLLRDPALPLRRTSSTRRRAPASRGPAAPKEDDRAPRTRARARGPNAAYGLGAASPAARTRSARRDAARPVSSAPSTVPA